MTFLEPTNSLALSDHLTAIEMATTTGPIDSDGGPARTCSICSTPVSTLALLVFRSRLQDHLAGKDQAGDTSSLASAA